MVQGRSVPRAGSSVSRWIKHWLRGYPCERERRVPAGDGINPDSPGSPALAANGRG